MVATRAGTIPFDAPGAGQPCETYYKVVGDLRCGKPALIALHGGPGATHDYLLPLIDLSESNGIPIVFYDQIGNGKSTHLREKAGDTAFWTVALFEAELENLIEGLELRSYGFDIIGHSWGGLLGSTFATSRPKGLGRLILSNSPASMMEWRRSEIAVCKGLPQDLGDLLLSQIDDKVEPVSARYGEAQLMLRKKHMYRLEPFPPAEMMPTLTALGDDDTVNKTMQGPGMITSGPVLHLTVVDRLHMIKNETLVINGEFDYADEGCVSPFFNHIPKVRWTTFSGTSHMTMLEAREKYMLLVAQFLGC